VNRKLVLRLVEARGDPARAGGRPTKANESWAMGFVFAGCAGGRTFPHGRCGYLVLWE
jgi:hypothetical protein